MTFCFSSASVVATLFVFLAFLAECPYGMVNTGVFEFPYAASLFKLGHEFQCLGLPKLRTVTATDTFLRCVARDVKLGFNAANAVCNCQASLLSASQVCERVALLAGDFVCSMGAASWFRRDCPKTPHPVLPVGFPEDEITLSFEEPHLPLPQSLPVDLIATEGRTYLQLYRAIRRVYALASNWKCLGRHMSSFDDIDILPGWRTEEVLLPIYRGAKEKDESVEPLAVVAKKGKDLLIVLRGSKAFAEWLAGLDYAQIDAKLVHSKSPGKVARGWGTIAINLLGVLQPRFEEIKRNPGLIERVIITGHSLGGTVSSLLTGAVTEILSHSGVKVFGVHFASNRVGNYEFASSYASSVNSRFFQFGLDPVPWFRCQSEAVCNKESKVPIVTSNDGRNTPICYAQMAGVAQFLPQFGGSYFLRSPPNNIEQVVAAHVCSYNCWLSALFLPEGDPEDAECSFALCPFTVHLTKDHEKREKIESEETDGGVEHEGARHPMVPGQTHLGLSSSSFSLEEQGGVSGSLQREENGEEGERTETRSVAGMREESFQPKAEGLLINLKDPNTQSQSQSESGVASLSDSGEGGGIRDKQSLTQTILNLLGIQAEGGRKGKHEEEETVSLEVKSERQHNVSNKFVFKSPIDLITSPSNPLKGQGTVTPTKRETQRENGKETEKQKSWEERRRRGDTGFPQTDISDLTADEDHDDLLRRLSFLGRTSQRGTKQSRTKACSEQTGGPTWVTASRKMSASTGASGGVSSKSELLDVLSDVKVKVQDRLGIVDFPIPQ
eukprot:Cvel_17662.t1-p1 / transcript=Cvel_17662.t1 / gene=Cvel_17662 / organism=Chromera_velia_CCMP2878 / gene_product=hypothetical protein / transcript_product=hypothetical protein / location=Cvel_scaffold1422:40417-45884(+) / protein_length=781 / sequence_SO=supercontig / SO=protein_coding / is_pseudo=false